MLCLVGGDPRQLMLRRQLSTCSPHSDFSSSIRTCCSALSAEGYAHAESCSPVHIIDRAMTAPHGSDIRWCSAMGLEWFGARTNACAGRVEQHLISYIFRRRFK